MSATKLDPLSYMQRAIRVAEKARGTCAPNPFVGAVIAKRGQIIAEGCSQFCGGDHAEIQALRIAGAKARGADLYVTLEPCSHHGKTPPCTDAIIRAGIKRVFLGIGDPNPLVNGQGIQQLQNAGIEVQAGLCAEQIKRQLEYFLCRITKGRPFVIWKAALSMDGKYAAKDGSSRWISGARPRLAVHRLREEADVIITGIGSVLKDDPLLNVRLPRPRKQPLRAILDSSLRLPMDSQIAASAKEYPTILFCATGQENTAKARELSIRGVQIQPVQSHQDRLNLAEILDFLHSAGHYCVLLECGSKLASSFFDAHLVDKCIIHYGAKLVGGPKSILSELALPDISAAIPLRDVSYRKLGDDFSLIGYPVFK